MKGARWITAPNVVTLFRMVLVPAFAALELSGSSGWALGCFAVAGFSDVLDGLLARVLNQRTWLGSVLDPLADKLLSFVAVAALTLQGRLPIWLILLIGFRDASFLTGALIAKRKSAPLPTTPTRIGKYATFGLVCLIVLALLDETLRSSVLHAYTQVVGVLAGLCIVISTVQYFVRFFVRLSRRTPSLAEEKSPSAPAPTGPRRS